MIPVVVGSSPISHPKYPPLPGPGTLQNPRHQKRRRQFRTIAAFLGVALASTLSASALACTMTLIEEWQVRSINNHLIVDGTLNDHPIRIMLDTGAMATAILQSAARRLDLPRRRAIGYRMFGVGGETEVEVTNVDSFRIGPSEGKARRMFIIGAPDFAPGFDVMLGDDFFHKVDVEFDLAHGAVRLFDVKGCDAVSLAYWAKEGTGEAAIEAVHEAAPQIVIPVEINGSPMLALLDSGAQFSIMTKRDAAVAGLTPKTPDVIHVGRSGGVGPKKVDLWLGPINTFTIGNTSIRDTAIVFADLFGGSTYKQTGSLLPRQPDPDEKMLLGMDFLRAHRVLVAHSQRKLYFSYVGGTVFQPRHVRSPDRGSPAGDRTTLP